LVEGTVQEMGFQAFLKTASDGTDVVFCGSVPQPGSSDRKSSIADS